MIPILLDTNIILDIALKREKFYNDAACIFIKIHKKELSAYISASSITDIFYLLKKSAGKEVTRQFLMKLIKFVDIIEVNRKTVIEALSLQWNDFEDAIQECVALHNNINIIITRNKKDFSQSQLTVLSPSELLNHLS